MMEVNPQASIARVAAGNYTPEDVQVVISALQAGQTLALGDRSVALGGSANDTVIVPGDNNKILIRKGATQAEIRQVLLEVLPQFLAVPVSTPELSPEELRDATLVFLQDVENKFRETQLFHTKQPILLKDQYVPIQVTLEPHKRDVETLRGYWETEEELKRAYALKGGEEELKRQQVDWQQAKQKHQRIMVLADPGMGKSTLLRMEAGTMAEEELQKLQNHQTPIDPIILPLFLRLSELAKQPEELIETIPLLIARDYPNTAPLLLPHLIQRLKTGKCLLLLDALDEVPKIDRNALKEKLDRFVSNYPCPVICTSRIVGYDGNFLVDGQEVEIVPFRETQIEQYVTTWFDNAAEHISDETVSAAALIRELRSKPQVRGLVQNPLLLSLICSLYQEQGLTLPARRVQVYEKAVAYMLEKWNRTRPSQFAGKTRAKLRLLEALAYHFSCKNQEVFDLDDLYDWMEGYLDQQAPRDLRDAGTEALIAEFSEEDGILQKLNPDDDHYLFLHRTFQEYLTACYLARAEDGIERAKEHCWEYDWHETISLMAGLMKEPLPLLQAIKDEKDDIFKTQLLLAGRCVAECGESSDPLITEIINRVYQFWLDDPVAEFIRSVVVVMGQTHSLLYEQIQTALNHADSDVRRSAAEALGWIGSDTALDALISALDRAHSWDLVGSSAAEALGRIGSDTALDALISALNRADSLGLVRSSAAVALGRIGSDTALDTLISALNHEDSDLRERAAWALGQMGSDKALDALISALNGADGYVRQRVVWALGQMGSDKALDALISALNGADGWGLVMSIEVWGLTNTAPTFDALITALNRADSLGLVRSSAAEALGQMGSDKALDALISALNHGDSDLRERAAEALGQMGSDKALDALISALNHENKFVRERAAEALGWIGSDKALDALITTLNDEDIQVRSSAAEALGRIGSDKALDALISALNDDYLGWRAAEALRRIGSPTCLAKLIQSPQIDIYHSNIFSLARSLAVRFSKAGFSFIPVYPERLKGGSDDEAMEF